MCIRDSRGCGLPAPARVWRESWAGAANGCARGAGWYSWRSVSAPAAGQGLVCGRCGCCVDVVTVHETLVLANQFVKQWDQPGVVQGVRTRSPTGHSPWLPGLPNRCNRAPATHHPHRARGCGMGALLGAAARGAPICIGFALAQIPAAVPRGDPAAGAHTPGYPASATALAPGGPASGSPRRASRLPMKQPGCGFTWQSSRPMPRPLQR